MSRKRETVLRFAENLTREDAKAWLKEILVNFDEEQLDRVICSQNLEGSEA